MMLNKIIILRFSSYVTTSSLFNQAGFSLFFLFCSSSRQPLAREKILKIDFHFTKQVPEVVNKLIKHFPFDSSVTIAPFLSEKKGLFMSPVFPVFHTEAIVLFNSLPTFIGETRKGEDRFPDRN